MSDLVFYVNPLGYTSGQLLRARFCNGDTRASAFEMPLVETVLAGGSSYSATAASPATNFANSLLCPYFVVVRSVTAQTTASFDDATSAKLLTSGDVDYLVNGNWSAPTIALAGPPAPVTVIQRNVTIVEAE